MTEMVHGSVPSGDGEPILPKWWRTIDRWSLSCVLLLFAIGILLGLAASPPLAERNGLPQFFYVERQAIFGSMALLAIGGVSMLSPMQVRRLSILGFVVAFVGLALLTLFGTDFGKGATRWYSLGFGSVQPSEFVKPGFIVLAAWLIASSRDLKGPPGIRLSLGLALIICAFLAAQPDFGQSVLILFAWFVMYFAAGASLLLLAGLAALTVAAGALAYSHSEHFARRIDGFLSGEIDPTTQLGYAEGAIREGGFLGVGVGEGRVKWSLPDAHTDFIIAVAAEEYGLILVLFIIGLFATVVVRSLIRLMKERDPFVRLAGTGIACTFGIQAIINLSVAVRLVPAKGMTLPFVSYGGSSLVAAGITIGILLALTRSRPQGEIEDALMVRAR